MVTKENNNIKIDKTIFVLQGQLEEKVCQIIN
jgi:hypothetical protein